MKFLPFLLALGVVSCTHAPSIPCAQSLQARDARFLEQVDSLLEAPLPVEEKKAAITALEEDEELLFRDARQCDFGKDLTAYNYWHRGRLKFPGKIESALKTLETEQ